MCPPLILVGKQPVGAEPRVGQLMYGKDQDGREVFVVQRLIFVIVPRASDLQELFQHRADELAPLLLVRPPPLPLCPSGDDDANVS